MIDAWHAAVWCPGFLGLRVRWTQGNVGFLGSDVYPSRAVPALAFAAHSKLRKRRLQETDHPLDVTYSNVRVFEPNSHCIPPIPVPGLMRPALWLALFVKPQEARRVVVADIAFLRFGKEVGRLDGFDSDANDLWPHGRVRTEHAALAKSRIPQSS